jgi:hypothetical protein
MVVVMAKLLIIVITPAASLQKFQSEVYVSLLKSWRKIFRIPYTVLFRAGIKVTTFDILMEL